VVERAGLATRSRAGYERGEATPYTSPGACSIGLKAKGRNAVRLANSDPAVIRHFAEFLRVEFGVADEQFRITCNLFADHEGRQREIEDFWLATLGLGRASLCKSIVNRYSKYSKKKRKNKLPYGTCHIAVHSTEIVQTIYGSIQELAGFDRPEWLDLP